MIYNMRKEHEMQLSRKLILPLEFQGNFVQHIGSQHQQNLLLILSERYTALYMIIRLQ